VLVQSGANVLILDEPTNHLDIESRESLEDALQGFEGAILLVSHDRALLDAVGTRTIAVEDGTLHSYVGGWPEYVRVREERSSKNDRKGTAHVRSPGGAHARLRQPAHAPAGTAIGKAHAPAGTADGKAHAPAGATGEPNGRNGAAAEKPKRKPKPKGPSKSRISAQQNAEQAVEEAEAALRAVEEELADPAAWATQYESAKSQARHTAATRAVEQAYAGLEAVSD
jgi:ATP-binding cassette subfamily F protein 3